MFSRRNFLKLGLAAGTIAMLSNSFELFQVAHRTFKQKTEVYDVLVIGGGPAGVAAAISAAREGCTVALVERSGYLGGMGTIGMVSTFMKTTSVHGLYGRDILNNVGRSFDPRKFDALLKHKIDEEIRIDLYLDTIATDVIMAARKIRGIQANNAGNSLSLYGSIVIDATGNGDIFALAGAPWVSGRESKAEYNETFLGLEQADNRVQGHSLCCILEEKTGSDHLLPKPVNYDPGEFAHFIFADNTPFWDSENEYFWQATWYPVNFGDFHKRYLLNHTHVYGNTSTMGPEELAKLKKEAQARLHRFVYHIQNFMGKREWGTADIFGTPYGFAPALGIRESRRLRGEYVLSEQDLVLAKKPMDTIALVSQTPDIHVCSPAEEKDIKRTRGYGYTWPLQVQQTFEKNGGMYGIPFRSLLPVGVENLIVAGRCISGTHIAQSSYRMQPYCYAQGEAAGLAASIAVKTKVRLQDLNIAYLQKKLLANYALLANFNDLGATKKDYPYAALAVLHQALRLDQDSNINLDGLVTTDELWNSLINLAQNFSSWPPITLTQNFSGRPATRLDLALIAVPLFQLPRQNDHKFVDIPDPLLAHMVQSFMAQPVLEDYAETIASGRFRPDEQITRRTLAYAVSGLIAPYVPMPHQHEQGAFEYAWIYLFGNRSYERLQRMAKRN